MALRLANKINRHIVRNAYRSLSAKREAEIEPILQKTEEITKAIDVLPQNLPLNGTTIPAQYEVCRPRTSTINPFPHSVQNETDVAKKTVAMQHLQPSMLPEYYKPPVEINSACMYFDPITETDRQATTKYRQFEQSKTCTNVTLPLRAPKLASPFPDPVKVMQSHTTSDQEKAEQMLAESKIMKGCANKNKQNKYQSIRTMTPNRSYSTFDKCGKKKDKPTKKVCPCVKVPGCRPVKSIKCGKTKKERPVCMRKPPPYPSYSETCHEDPYNKPSECKTCPYKPDEHPYFKPTKQDFHTSVRHTAKARDDCPKPASQGKKPCGWVKENKEKPHNKQQEEKEPQPKKKAMINLSENLTGQKMSQSEQTPIMNFKSKNFPFLPPKPKAYEKQKETEETQNNAISAKTKLSAPLGNEMGTWLNLLHPDDVLSTSGVLQVAEAEQEEKGKCKKFPFKECTFTIVKERKERPPANLKCPPKPKRKLTKDCPADKNDDKCRRSSSLNNVMTYLMSDEPGNTDDKPKKKCPKVNVGICKDPNQPTDDDPCKRKKTGKTEICPGDLLSRKPRSKKKTSPVFPLAQIPNASRSYTAIKL